MRKKLPFSYSWIIIAVTFICMLAIYGIRYSFAAFFSPILEEFGWSRGSTAFMFALSVLVYGLLAPISGSLADHWKPKPMMAMGVLMLGLSTAGCALANELWHFYLLFGVLMPLGAAFSGAPILIPAINNWFVGKRGMAIGTAIAGSGLSFFMVTYAEFLISILGWRLAFVVIASSVVGIVMPLVLVFFRYRPKSQAQITRDIEGIPKKSNESVKAVNVTDNHYSSSSGILILKNYRLWLLMLTYLLYDGFANYLIVAHQVIFFVDLGYSSIFAASVAGLIGVFFTIGTLFGFVSDLLGREKAFTLATVLSITSLFILLLQNDASNPWAMYIFASCFGFAMGLISPTIIAGSADLFPGKHFGMVTGFLLMGFGLGGAIGPWFGGYIFDTTGSYSIAFIGCIFAYCLAYVSFWIAAPRKAKIPK